MSSHHSSNGSTTPQPQIAVEVNSATRTLHTELNRIIVDRLPLALPPHAKSPSRYAIGLSHFANIFFSFEAEFDRVLESVFKEKEQDEVRAWIAGLRPSGIERSKRLRNDLYHLQKSAIVKFNVADSQRTSRGIKKLLTGCQEKPHVLIAYAWIMYMAVFSGGRWIRQQLASAGTDFWLGSETLGSEPDDEQIILQQPGFTFLSFDGDHDGEELKKSFKAQLDDADIKLTAKERQEVVAAGQDLFQHCINLIEEIDRDVWWQESTATWPIPVVFLCFGLAWIIWRAFSGQSVFTE